MIKKIIIILMVLVSLIGVGYAQEIVEEDTADYIDSTSFWDRFSLSLGFWLVEPPSEGCELISKKTTKCLSYEDSQNRKLYSSDNPSIVQWAFVAFKDASCTDIYQTISSGTYEDNGDSGSQKAPIVGKYYAFKIEKYICGSCTHLNKKDCKCGGDIGKQKKYIYCIYCKSDGTWGTEYLIYWQCPIGTACKNAECIILCTDTDLGKDYYKLGITQVTDFEPAIDYCKDKNTLIEYSCNEAGDNYLVTQYTCPYGCENGACKSKPVSPEPELIPSEVCEKAGGDCLASCVDGITESTIYSCKDKLWFKKCCFPEGEEPESERCFPVIPPVEPIPISKVTDAFAEDSPLTEPEKKRLQQELDNYLCVFSDDCTNKNCLSFEYLKDKKMIEKNIYQPGCREPFTICERPNCKDNEIGFCVIAEDANVTKIPSEITATSVSLTGDDWDKATPETIVASICKTKDNCVPYDRGYQVDCITTPAIKQRIDESIKDVCKTPKGLFKLFAGLTGFTCAGGVVVTVASGGILAPAMIGCIVSPTIFVGIGGIALATEAGCEMSKFGLGEGTCRATLIVTNGEKDVWSSINPCNFGKEIAKGFGAKKPETYGCLIGWILVIFGFALLMKMFGGEK